MRIANPIYDVIFKYLMENLLIARDLLSAILSENILSLELQPQELVGQVEGEVKVTRMDFKAIIKNADGTLKVTLIELEKNKRGMEIPRFRRYLGANYGKETVITTADGKLETLDLPIVLIYFLGYELDQDYPTPVLSIERTYKDALTGEIFTVKDNFIEALSHDLYIIQIPKLKMAVQTELEELLDVFNVIKYKTNDKRVLEYTGDSTNAKVKRIVKHLNNAVQMDKIVETMKMEDEYEGYLLNVKRQKEAAEQQAKIAQQKAEVAQQKAEVAQQKAEVAEQKAANAEREKEVVKEEAAREIAYWRQLAESKDKGK